MQVEHTICDYNCLSQDITINLKLFSSFYKGLTNCFEKITYRKWFQLLATLELYGSQLGNYTVKIIPNPLDKFVYVCGG